VVGGALVIANEYLYPIYQFTLWYVIEHPTKYHDFVDRYNHKWVLLPPVETLCWDRMYRRRPKREELEADVRQFWISNLRAPRGSLPTLADQGAVLVGFEVEDRGRDTWCIDWFSHYTYNVHLTDEELLESFEHFVRRKMPAHVRLQALGAQERAEGEYYCLMGAEDRWRWKGPCRCEHCQQQGIVRIDH